VAAADRDEELPYYNSGCWTELPCTYLTVAGGVVQDHVFEPAAVAKEEVSIAPAI
jgi:hypothetical protein